MGSMVLKLVLMIVRHLVSPLHLSGPITSAFWINSCCSVEQVENT